MNCAALILVEGAISVLIRRGNPWFVSLQIDVMGLGSRDGDISIHMTA